MGTGSISSVELEAIINIPTVSYLRSIWNACFAGESLTTWTCSGDTSQRLEAFGKSRLGAAQIQLATVASTVALNDGMRDD